MSLDVNYVLSLIVSGLARYELFVKPQLLDAFRDRLIVYRVFEQRPISSHA